MKSIRLITLSLLFLIHYAPQMFAQTTSGSVEYMEKIFNSLNSSKEDTWQYLKAVTAGKAARKVESKRQVLLAELKRSKAEIMRMSAFEGNDSLKQAAVKYLDLSYSVLKEDYDKILDMEAIVEQSYDLMEAYILAQEQASDKLEESFDELVAAQRLFAQTYHINLIEGKADETSKKIERASQTLKYYHQIYLIFFKSYKQEAYVLDAMQRNDVNGIEQSLNSLSVYTAEGLEKLNALQAHEGDMSLLKAGQNILNFYKTEAQRDFPQVVDFYIKNENFNQFKKTFDQINPKNRTQQDVDQYNKFVNEINEAVKKVNKLNDTMNTSRKTQLDYWNQTADRFVSAHAD